MWGKRNKREESNERLLNALNRRMNELATTVRVNQSAHDDLHLQYTDSRKIANDIRYKSRPLVVDGNEIVCDMCGCGVFVEKGELPEDMASLIFNCELFPKRYLCAVCSNYYELVDGRMVSKRVKEAGRQERTTDDAYIINTRGAP